MPEQAGLIRLECFRRVLAASFLLICCVSSTAHLAIATDDHRFTGMYEIRQSSESEQGVHVSIAVRILNQGSRSLDRILVRLEDPSSILESRSALLLQHIDMHGATTVEGEFLVSREEYQRWGQGESPVVSLEFVELSGEVARYQVALAPALIEAEGPSPQGGANAARSTSGFMQAPISSAVIETVAGGGPDGIPAASANLNHPYALAVDAQDNVYVTAQGQRRVFKIDAQGIITVVVGTGVHSFMNSDGLPGRSANISEPQGLAVDANGYVYVGLSNQRVYRIDKTTGILTKVAGGGTLNADGVLATDAYLSRTEGLAVDPWGNIYISDQGTIRRVDGSTGVITRFVGNGTYGYSGDGGPAGEAVINGPANLAVDRAGNLFIADEFNGRIRRVDAVTGTITTVAGGGSGWDGVPATSARLIFPHGVEVDRQGNLYITSAAIAGGSVVRYVDAVSGIISTVAGGGTGAVGGPATSALLNSSIEDVALDSSGNLLIAEHNSYWGRISRVDAVSRIITTLAGNGSVSFSGDGYQAGVASLSGPTGVAVDSNDDLLISDTRNSRVRRRSASTGTIQTVAGGYYSSSGGDGGPATMAWIENPSEIFTDSSGNYFVLDGRFRGIRRVDAQSGIITTVGGAYGNAGLAVRDGILFFSIPGSNQVIRKDLTTGLQTVYAGGGFTGGLGDGGQAVSARLSRPTGLSFDPLGNLLIADKDNRRIRRVDKSTGIITTILGGGVSWGENVLAGNVSLSDPVAAAYDDSGGLLVLEAFPPRLRRLDPVTGLITTIAGTGNRGFSGDGGPPTSATFSSDLVQFTLDQAGNIYLADRDNDRIRRIRFPLDTDRDGLSDDDETRLGTDQNDPDSDGDGLLDGFEAGYGTNPLVPGEQSLDLDADGLDNISEQQLRTSPTNADSDGDGLTDGNEVRLTGTHPLSSDTDADSILDGVDNCGLARNLSQADFIHPNGVGDDCDDPDGDGDMDSGDNCPDAANPAQEERVHRGNKVGDACDDPDGDGVPDVRDNCPDTANSSQADTDSDGIADGCDVCPSVANPAQSEHLACLEATQNGGRCLESQISINLGQRNGEIQVVVDKVFVPQSITFELNASSCDVLEPVELTLNGVVVGTFIEQIPTCDCVPPRRQVVFDDPILMNQLWRLDGNNLLGARKTVLTPPGTFAGTFVSWIKATVSASGFSLDTCVMDIGGGDCTEPDQCRGGWTLDSFSQETTLSAPLQGYIIHSSAILSGAGLPASMPIDTVPDGPAKLCVSADPEKTLFGSSGGGELFRVDPVTATGRPIGMLPLPDGEIEYDDAGQRAFVQSLNGITRQQFDIRTGEGIGSPSATPANTTALEYVGARLYAIRSSFSPLYPYYSWLYQLEPTFKFIGETGAGHLTGLAYDGSRGRMFASGYAANITPALFSIDLQSGIASSIASLPFQALSLEFGADGMLYAGGNTDVAGGLYRIDPDTGASTFIGSTGYPYVQGLTLASPAYRDCIPFLKQGEYTLTINGAPCVSPPRAVAGTDSVVECVSPSGGPVRLDGSGSTDLDSTPGTHDDIVSFEWFEGFGSSQQSLLGTGARVDLNLPLGAHSLTLRTTDRTGQTGLDSVDVVVIDRTPPTMSLGIDTQFLWPPNHRMIPVGAVVASSDLCGASHVVLDSIASSEPDDAEGTGDGSTLLDVQEAMQGEADVAFFLRAERDGSGRGRIYSITYRSTDDSGNATSLIRHVTVPHELNGATDPMVIAVEQTAAGTLISWNDFPGAIYYNVVRGYLANVRETAQLIELGPLYCIGAGVRVTDTRGFEDTDVPIPGGAFFYLAEYSQGLNSSFGEEDVRKPRIGVSGGCP